MLPHSDQQDDCLSRTLSHGYTFYWHKTSFFKLFSLVACFQTLNYYDHYVVYHISYIIPAIFFNRFADCDTGCCLTIRAWYGFSLKAFMAILSVFPSYKDSVYQYSTEGKVPLRHIMLIQKHQLYICVKLTSDHELSLDWIHIQDKFSDKDRQSDGRTDR